MFANNGTVAAILLGLWALGWASGAPMGAWIHLFGFAGLGVGAFSIAGRKN